MVNYASDEDAYPERAQRVEGPLLNPTRIPVLRSIATKDLESSYGGGVKDLSCLGSGISGLPRPGGRGGLVTSSCNQEVLREGPFAVDPLAVAPESRAGRHLRNFFGFVFVRAFRPDGFVFV